MSPRVAIVADAAAAGLHGLDGQFEWGEGRTFAPDEHDGLAAWEPATVIALAAAVPDGPWRAIAWGFDGERRVATAGEAWRWAPLPAAAGLAALCERPGAGVVVAGGDAAARESALAKLHARGVDARGCARLTAEALESAAVVALLGTPGDPLPDAAPAVLAAGRVLVAPRAEPAFGLLPWSDHLPYDNEDELVCAADAAQTHPDAFEPIVALGVLAAAAHAAPAVYGRLAADAELEAAA